MSESRSGRGVRLIAVTGGIGSGKSLICRMLSVMGYPVYDCDSRAKKIMDASPRIHQAIARDISGAAIEERGGETFINRKTLAEVVFGNPAKLACLNGIVHSAVKHDVERWRDGHLANSPANDTLFVETAILRQSGMDAMVDEIWEVYADPETRISRAMMRDNATRCHIEARMESQAAEKSLCADCAVPVRVIDNNGDVPLLPQLLRLLGQRSKE